MKQKHSKHNPTTATPHEAHNTSASVLRELVMGFRTTQLIAVAAKLNLAQHIQQGTQTTTELATLTHTAPHMLYRLLRALASLGIFQETQPGTFAITPLAALLADDTPGSMRSLAILYGEEWLWQAYARLLYTVQSGETAFHSVHGLTLYDYLQQHTEAACTFHKAMSGYTDIESAAIIKAYDFSSMHTVVDVGGGEGALVTSLLNTNTNLSGIVFDVPEVINKRISTTAKPNIDYVAGNFFVGVPDHGDIYILKSVLHNWDDAAAIHILSNCRKAMLEKSKILVIERIVPTGNEKSEAKLFDINMLVMTGGQERTTEEYRKLFYAAGLTVRQTIPTQSAVSIIEGVPAEFKAS